MNIAIIGTRGIPNKYGGFEQFAEYLSRGLVQKGHSVTVYAAHSHEYKKATFEGVRIKRKINPYRQLGAAAHYLYDFLSLKDALKRESFDIIYEAGYGSSALSFILCHIGRIKHPVIVTNMDGLEWKRDKWNKIVKGIIRFSEKVAVKKSHYLISDNKGIQQYLKTRYDADSFYLPYGADPGQKIDPSVIPSFDLLPYSYCVMVARLEPENNIEMVINGLLTSSSEMRLLIIGDYNTNHARYLRNKYINKRISFLGGLYDKNKLDALRHFSKIYFHGHSVGGTNPSLLEAMANGAFISAHDNIFNRSVLGGNGIYFKTSFALSRIVDEVETGNYNDREKKVRQNNVDIVKQHFTWDKIVNDYEEVFNDLMKSRS